MRARCYISGPGIKVLVLLMATAGRPCAQTPDASGRTSLPGEIRTHLTTRDNVRLAGSLFLPLGPDSAGEGAVVDTSRAVPGVVLLHMWKRTRHEWDAVVPALQRRGMAVVSIDMRGHGESEPHRTEPYDAYYTPYMKKDAITAWEYLIRHAWVDRSRLVIVGASIGTTNAIRLCEHINRRDRAHPVAAMALLSPADSYFGVYVGDLLSRCRKTPALFMMATDDPRLGETKIFTSGQRMFAAFKGEKKMVLHQGEGHGTGLLALEGWCDTLVTWIDARLGTTHPQVHAP